MSLGTYLLTHTHESRDVSADSHMSRGTHESGTYLLTHTHESGDVSPDYLHDMGMHMCIVVTRYTLTRRHCDADDQWARGMHDGGSVP